jgi:solute carrier family 25 (mitochondrial phosphate transporter), member 23/24/25/41
LAVSSEELEAFIFHIDTDEDGRIDFKEWCEFLLFSPKRLATMREIYSFYLNIIHHSDTLDLLMLPTKKKKDTGVTFKYLIAGAIAGAVSRTCTAPLDRLRVLLQVQTRTVVEATFIQRCQLILHSVKQIYMDGGIKSFWRGNGVNVIKIIPESATRFYVYESVKKYLVSQKSVYSDKSSNGQVYFKSNEIGTKERMIAGGIAGFMSQCLIYPLETIKTRMMAEMSTEAVQYTKDHKFDKKMVKRKRVSAVSVARAIIEQGGFRAFFRGIGTSLVG